MGASILRFSLDVHKTQSQVTVSASQYSTDKRLMIRLMERGIPYEIEDGCFAVFSAIKPDGKPLYNDCMIRNNTIIYDFTKQTTPVVGIIPCQIHLYGADGRILLAPRFQIIVHEAVYDGNAVESSAEYLAMSEYINHIFESYEWKGEKVFIRYSANSNGANFTEFWSEGKKYIGFATGLEAPESPLAYKWALFCGGQVTVTVDAEKATASHYSEEIYELLQNNTAVAAVLRNGIYQDYQFQLKYATPTDAVFIFTEVDGNGMAYTEELHIYKDGVEIIANESTAGNGGENGTDGLTPFIGENGNWHIGDEDTGVNAEGKDGAYVTSIDELGGDATKTTYRMNFSDGSHHDFDVYHGRDGKDGKDGTNGVNGADGKDGKDGVSVTHAWVGTTLKVTSASGTTSADLKGEKGGRGTGIISISGGLASHTATVGGVTSAYRILLSKITETWNGDVLVGDSLRYSTYLYPVIYVDSTYAYCSTRVSIQGKDGATGATGADGKSAYQIWLDAGNSGTEQDFLNSLKATSDGLEPSTDDIPMVFIDGAIPTTKDDVLATLTYVSETETFAAYITIKCQGNTSMNYDKKNFTIKLFSDETRETKLKKKFKDWKYEKHKYVLKANFIDHSHMRNIFSANLWSEVVESRDDYDSLPAELRNSPNNGAVDGFPVKVYTNGTYQGMYTWNIGKDDWMWGMDEENPNHVLLCGGHNSDGEFKERPYNFRALWDGVAEYWEVEVGTASTAITNSLNNLISFVMNNNGSAFKNGLGTYLDVQSAIDYYIHQYVICGLDGLAKNMLLGTYNGTKWYCGAYDMDSTFGLYYNGRSLVSASYQCPEDYQEKFSLLWERMEENFWSEIKTRYAELRKTVYTTSRMFTYLERFTDLIGAERYAEDLEIYPSIPSGSTNNIKQLRSFIRDRLAYCDQKITGGIPATSITLNKSTVEINKSESLTATVTATVLPANHTDSILWLTSDANVATVKNGVITGGVEGTCTIRAKCGSGYATCTVTVTSAAQPTYTNQVPISEERILDGDKSNSASFTYDGVGYGTGHRLSSSGYVKTLGAPSVVTGFIPAKGGDTIRIVGVDWFAPSVSSNYVCAYDHNYAFIGACFGGLDGPGYGTNINGSHEVLNTNDVALTLENVSNIAFIRVSSAGLQDGEVNGANMIVTVNEEIK